MGSSDYLNSARRAAIVFFLLVAGTLGAAGYGLAVSLWGGAPADVGADAKPRSEPLGRAGGIDWGRAEPLRANLSVAEGSTGGGKGM